MNILIETERLQMRQFTLDDVDAVYEFGHSEEVTRYTGDAGAIKNKADAQSIIENVWLAEYEKYGYARYALIHKADNKVIGFCGVKYEPELGCPDIGYRMLKQYWGQGLGFEAAEAALNYARNELKLARVVAEVVDENTASAKILQKLGFTHTKTYQEDGFTVHFYE
ncbi:GNAT family N-acetyltransferase [Litorilituus lipolyticus]|uniref:N-acetyltransferase n=1 Tax=Litorilituus lipolyticus TaxID=2491017 RepID=A0A502L157_9GAMM|nr:GNAT family N-acetyltransferase [Litorilituus lipolyticus]TPH16589.1 N-acetyltransferase [Litorilituus lipolyticus]